MSSLFRWGMLAGRAPPASARQQAQAGSTATATVLVPKARLEEAHARHQLQLGALQAELESSNALVNSLRQQRDTWKGMSVGHKDMFERKLKEAQFGFESREESLRTLLEAEQAHGAVMRQRLQEAHQSLQELAGRLCDREALIEELRGRRNTEAGTASDNAVQQLRAELAAVQGRAQAQGALLSALQQCGYHMSQCVNREQLEQHAAALTQLLGQISGTLEGSGVQGVEHAVTAAAASEDKGEEEGEERGQEAGAVVFESAAAANKARQQAEEEEEGEEEAGLPFVCMANEEIQESAHEKLEQLGQHQPSGSFEGEFSSESSSTAPAPTSAPRPALVFERCAVRLSRGRSQLTAAVQLGSFPQHSEVMQQYQRRVAAHEEREAEAREVEQTAAAACVKAQAAATAAVAAATAAVGRRQAQAQQGGRTAAVQAKRGAEQGAAKQQRKQRKEVEERKEREERRVKEGGVMAAQALGGDGLVVVQLVMGGAAAAAGVQGGNVQANGMCKQGRGGNRGRRGGQKHVLQAGAAQ